MITASDFAPLRYAYDHRTPSGLIRLVVERWHDDEDNVTRWSAHGFDYRGMPDEDDGEHFPICNCLTSMADAVAAVNKAVAALPPRHRVWLTGAVS